MPLSSWPNRMLRSAGRSLEAIDQAGTPACAAWWVALGVSWARVGTALAARKSAASAAREAARRSIAVMLVCSTLASGPVPWASNALSAFTAFRQGSPRLTPEIYGQITIAGRWHAGSLAARARCSLLRDDRQSERTVGGVAVVAVVAICA